MYAALSEFDFRQRIFDLDCWRPTVTIKNAAMELGMQRDELALLIKHERDSAEIIAAIENCNHSALEITLKKASCVWFRNFRPGVTDAISVIPALERFAP